MKIDIKGAIVSNDDAWIYDWFGETYTSPKNVSAALEEANGEDVDIEINSGGGDVFAGSEIYAAIRAYPGTVNIHVVGLAASAASVIACAAKSDIAPTAQMMVHNVSTWAAGNYHDMDHASNMLKQANRAIAAAYVEKSGMSEKDALDLMDAETWITAQDAVDYGLIDKIAGSQNSVQDEDASVRLAASVGGMLPPSVINKMQKRKQALLDYFSE
jgi:ATP-dependent protease ClpP protease subunit